MKPMMISEFAARAGIGLETVRYYERRGLLPRPLRGPQGYRYYGLDSLRQVELIRGARQLGFSLREVESILSSWTKGATRCPALCETAMAKIQHIERQIAELHSRKRKLKTLMSQCTAAGGKSCSVAESRFPN